MNSVSAREGLLKQVLLKQVGQCRLNMLQHGFLCQAGNSFLADPTFPQRAIFRNYLQPLKSFYTNPFHYLLFVILTLWKTLNIQEDLPLL